MTESPEPPVASKKLVVKNHHGITSEDPYAWLKDENWMQVMQDPSVLTPEIRSYLEAENTYTAEAMANTKDLQKTLFSEMRGRIKEDDSSVPSPDGPFAYAVRFQEGAQHPIYVRFKREGGDEQTLIDGNVLAEGKAYFNLGDVSHSPNHGLLAWSSDINGSEYFTIRIRNLETNRDLPDEIQQTSGDAVFDAKGEYIFYSWLDENHRPCKIFRHKIGESQDNDKLVYEESDPGFFVGIEKSQSGSFIIIDCHDHQTSEVRIIDSHQPLAEPVLVAERIEEQLYSIEHHGDKFLIHTNADGAEDFKIVTAPVDSPGRENWNDLIPHRAGRLILTLIPYKNHLVRLERENGLPSIVIRRMDDSEEHSISFDEEAYSLGVDGGYEFDTTTVRFTYSSMTTPNKVFDYDMETRERNLRKEQEVPSGHNPEDYVTRRIMAPAHDGETIPVTLLYRHDLKLDGSAHCLLYGYGSYGISIPANFDTNHLSLVDRGFVYAVVHVRGGKEKGYKWYKEGRRENKVNTFNDFISAAKFLISEKITSEAAIIAHGGSAGGMLMGAIANMVPELFLGIIAEVPFVDVLNTMLDDTLPLTPPEWPEWGNPISDEQAYRTIAGYSPYDNVKNQSYPAILALAGLTDPRVTYWEPAKWVAKLRQAKTDGNPLLLKTNMEAGHAGASGRFDRLEEIAFNYAFALKIAGKLKPEDASNG